MSKALENAIELLKQLVLGKDMEGVSPTRQDIAQLLHARKDSMSSVDNRFDSALIEIGRKLDEHVRDGASPSAKKLFDRITDYFHKVEAASGHLNHLAFMGNSQITVEILVELKHDMEVFEAIEKGLFNSLFVEDLIKTPMLDSYGRRRIRTLLDGLSKVKTIKLQKSDMKMFDLQAVQDLIDQLVRLEEEERLFMVLSEIVSRQVKTSQTAISTPEGRIMIRQASLIELRQKTGIHEDIPESLFEKAFEMVKMEAIYCNAILPKMIKGNPSLRKDFIQKSGMDLFYIEDLEEQYCNRNGLSTEILRHLRSFGGDTLLTA